MSAEVQHHTKHIPEWKIREVDNLVKQINETSVVGLIGVTDIPARQFQVLREKLRGISTIKMVRNNIARRAIEKCSADIKPLLDHVEKQTAFIFTDVNSFKLCKMLDEMKSSMPIRAGGTSPIDIVIKKGDTPFSPGPMVGTLQNAGIPASIKKGKVVINETTTVVKEGETVSPQLAEVLELMEIYPRMVGFDLRAVHEGGLVFRTEDLTLDVEAILSQMNTAAAQVFGLATEIGYATPETIGPMLWSAASKARTLVMECAIPVPRMTEALLTRAAAQASSLSSLVEDGKKASEKAPKPENEAAKTEEKEDKSDEAEEEEAGPGGLSALFG
ncbi:MAG: 50S ribosomal protein L10 [Methanotrichaceae archaeon]